MPRFAKPRTDNILNTWRPFKEAMGVVSVHSEKDDLRALPLMETLLEEVGEDEAHPLAEVLDYLADQIAAHEKKHVSIPRADPSDVLRLLMTEHALCQKDLEDCAPQSRISDILNGRRNISKELAKRLAERFSVSPSVFL